MFWAPSFPFSKNMSKVQRFNTSKIQDLEMLSTHFIFPKLRDFKSHNVKQVWSPMFQTIHDSRFSYFPNKMCFRNRLVCSCMFNVFLHKIREPKFQIWLTSQNVPKCY